jgi:CheY-like chemotaxis protein
VPHLFTPFFTTKSPGHGTGLGLSLSYGMVESHGGRLTYASAPDGGAEFTVALPIMEPAAGLAAPDAELAVGAPSRGRRILLVDDDPAAQRFVSALFTPEGHTVEVTRSGSNALRLVEDASYDLVIADAAMGAGADELFVSAFLDRHPEWRDRLVIATPAHAPRPADLFPGEELHSVIKPFDLRALRALAAEIFGRVAA